MKTVIWIFSCLGYFDSAYRCLHAYLSVMVNIFRIYACLGSHDDAYAVSTSICFRQMRDITTFHIAQNIILLRLSFYAASSH